MVSGTGINRQSIDIEFYTSHASASTAGVPTQRWNQLVTRITEILFNELSVPLQSGNHPFSPLAGGIGILNTFIVNTLGNLPLFSFSTIEPTGNYDTRKIEITFRELDPIEVTNLGDREIFFDDATTHLFSELLDLPNLHVILRDSMATQLQIFFKESPLGGYIVKKLDNISIDYGNYDLIVANETNLTPISIPSDNNKIVGENWVIYGAGDGINKDNLTSVVLSENIEQMTISTHDTFEDDSKPFSEAVNLHTVILGENLFSIQRNAFDGCSSLNNIVFPGSIRFLGAQSFFDCGFGEIQFQKAPENESSLILQSVSLSTDGGELVYDPDTPNEVSDITVSTGQLGNCFFTENSPPNLNLGYLGTNIANDRKTNNIYFDLS